MAAAKPCSRGCGRGAFGGYPTCCTHCRGPDGPHTHDCSSKNATLKPPCERGCGRPRYGSFKTCCTHCKGRDGPHAGDCADKAKAQAAAAAAAPAAPAAPRPPGPGPAAAGGGGGPETVLGRCGNCGETFPIIAPPGAGPGARIGAVCPACKKPTEICLSGPAPAPVARPPRLSGQKRALLVGVNYNGTKAQLRGCVNDVRNIQQLLIEMGWPAACIRTLTDEDPDPRRMPTRRNIEANMHWLANGDRGASPGDVLFLHFSGHGSQKEDPQHLEEDGMNETILPVDFQSAGMITDDEITEIVVKPLPEYAKLTAIMDCCHSGTGMDLPYGHTSRGWKMETNPWFHVSDVQLFSGCEDSGTSADVSSRYGKNGGAMTTAFCEVLRASRNPPSYTQLIVELNKTMKARGFSQRPQLTSSQQFNFDRPFLLTDVVPNGNPTIGRVVNQRFPANPRPFASGDPLGGLLQELGMSPAVAAVAAGIGGLLLGKVLGDGW